MLIEIELLIIVTLLVILIVRISSLIKLSKFLQVTDPFFPVFDRESVYDAKVKFLFAKQKHAELSSELSSRIEKNTPADEQFKNRFQNSESKLSETRETLYKLIQSNIAALNGKDISSLSKDYQDWLMSQIVK
jgi:hypothetical protein